MTHPLDTLDPEEEYIDLIQQKWMKFGIGFLITIMMLGTALFSVQAFTGNFQLDSSGMDDSCLSSASSEKGEVPAHSMDRSPEKTGFLAVPWMPASFIRQALGRDVSLEQLKRFAGTYAIKSYPMDLTSGITDKNIRNMSNTSYHIQILSMHIAKLTAG